MTVPDDRREAGAEIEIAAVESRLAWMRRTRILLNGPRYLWTDAFGLVLLVSLWHEIRDDRLLRECEWVVAEVERVLGRPPGIRIGKEPDRGRAVLPLPGHVDLCARAPGRRRLSLPRQGHRARASHSPGVRHPRNRGHLEDARGPERPRPVARGASGSACRRGALDDVV